MKWMRKILRDSVLNPGSWTGWAIVLVAAWGVMHLLGWRVDTAVICGTVDPARGNSQWVMMRGILYALAYFGMVLISPVLLLASGLYVGMVVWSRRRGRKGGSTPETAQGEQRGFYTGTAPERRGMRTESSAEHAQGHGALPGREREIDPHP